MIGKRVKWYEPRSASQEEAFDRMMEVERCKDLISRRFYFYNALQRTKELAECWVREPEHQKTASLGSPWGFYVGMEEIQPYYTREDGSGQKGRSVLRTASTPVIYLAGDGKTAQGMWFVSGEETLLQPDGSLQGYHIFGRAGADLMLENGQWRIWHWADVYDMVSLAGQKVSDQPIYPTPEQVPFRMEFEAGNPTISMITHFPSTHSADGWPMFPCAHEHYGLDNSYAPEGHPGIREDCMDVNWEARMASYEAWGY